jgi:DNA-binding response OmpR family regulator
MEVFMRELLDLVLLDFNLVATDGGIIAFEMRRRRPEVRIAYLCGDTSREMPLNVVEGVIEKCVDRERLCAEVRRILETQNHNAA